MYHHRQPGHVIKWVVTGAAAVSALIIYMAAPQLSLVAIVVIIIAMAISFMFGSMTVEIKDGALTWWFGPGVWRKSVPVADITSAQVVRNTWWWGWGIRHYGKGWLYNVSGLDAVEVHLASGKQFRLGTDDPQGLAAALQAQRIQKN